MEYDNGIKGYLVIGKSNIGNSYFLCKDLKHGKPAWTSTIAHNDRYDILFINNNTIRDSLIGYSRAECQINKHEFIVRETITIIPAVLKDHVITIKGKDSSALTKDDIDEVTEKDAKNLAMMLANSYDESEDKEDSLSAYEENPEGFEKFMNAYGKV